jgi:hypothetical protein
MQASAPRDVCAGKCQPGGECAKTADGYVCTCHAGFSGTGTTSCTNIDECAQLGKHCAPGTCVDGINRYECMCPPGYFGNGGTACREACPKDACKPGGKCIDGPNGWSCDCELRTNDPKACPDVLMGQEILNSTTGLTWYWGCSFMKRPAAGDQEAARQARDYCAYPNGQGMTPNGYRWASSAEVAVAPAQIAAYGPGLCAFTPQGLHCAPGEDANASEVKVLCLR